MSVIQRLRSELDDQNIKTLALLDILRFQSMSIVAQKYPVTGTVVFACAMLESLIKQAPTDELAEMIRTKALEAASTQRDNG